MFARCSPETVRLRFFAPIPAFPREYVAALLGGRPDAHDAVVAYRHGPGGRAYVIGLGSLAAGGGGTGSGAAGVGAEAEAEAGAGAAGSGSGFGGAPAELGLMVADAWQRQGVGAAMLDALLARARARGVTRVSAFVLPGRSALLAALTRRERLEPETFAGDGDGLTGVYRLIPPTRPTRPRT